MSDTPEQKENNPYGEGVYKTTPEVSVSEVINFELSDEELAKLKGAGDYLFSNQPVIIEPVNFIGGIEEKIDGLDQDFQGTVVDPTGLVTSMSITRSVGDVAWSRRAVAGAKPVVDPDHEGQPGLPDFSKPPYATDSEAMPGKEPNYHWSPDLEKIKRNVPDYYVSNLKFTSMTHYYPFHDYDAPVGIQDIQDIEELLGQHEMNGEKEHKYHITCAALKNFFTTVKPSALATGCAMTYRGFVGNTEVMYIRFERDHVDPMTFVLREDTYNRFIEDWYAGITDPARQQRIIDWTVEANSDPNMHAKGYFRRVCQIAMEYPLDSLYPAETSIFDGMTNGDFKVVDDIVEMFTKRFNRFIGIATKQAETLPEKIKFRDHNLVLVFKGNKDLTGLTIGLDKVPPRLENGEFHLGEKPIDLDEWAKLGNSVLVTVRKISKVGHWVEQLIAECKRQLPNSQYAKDKFAKVMREQLLASSHFIKELYHINAYDIQQYVEQVAGGMVKALNDHGGNIGLDLNTWKVYQYQDNGLPPVPLVTEELNFRKNVYEVHTDRFMEILYTFMYGLSSPYIRPYTHKVVVDGNDGIKIGSIRHVKEAGDPLAEKPEPVEEAPVPTLEQIKALEEKGWENMQKE